HRFFEVATRLGLPNPRPISRPLLELASLFHPLLFASLTTRDGDGFRLTRFDQRLRARRLAQANSLDLVRYYLQSQLFLAGCTLSAAVIQQRHSDGTLDSK